MRAMNEYQIKIFWVWYCSAYNGTQGKRSFAKAAERSGIDEKIIRDWHKKFDWDKRAEEQDQKLYTKTAHKVLIESANDLQSAKERQKRFIDKIFDELFMLIQKAPAEFLKRIDIIKLMEHELALHGEGAVQSSEKGLLTIVLQNMKPESRQDFNAAIERARDTGALRLNPVGSPERN